MRPGRIVVTGSIAFDYLMTFPGRFLDVMVPDRLHRISVSFLVRDMRRVEGGCGANIAYGLALLGAEPMLMATAGPDASAYRSRLEAAGVDVTHVKLCEDVFTASFFANTDEDQNQICTFYGGAMSRAAELSFRSLDPAGIGLVVISPNDPVAMARYAAECRALGIPFLYDPSQQVSSLSGEEMLACLEGAAIFIGNEYELGIVEKKTGLGEAEILARVPVVIITRGAEGSTIALRGGTPEAPHGATTIRVPAAAVRDVPLDPTGVGDAYRAGLLAARRVGLPWETAGKVGAVAAVYALETIGPQPAPYSLADFAARYAASFGPDDGLARLGGAK
ncbi:MAG TPA: carbohydrate kinase family protein [Candidatus Binatia bacterium]|nr:carbohydrate kinase family protein [Candidatus Binatia bacterium]